MIPTVHLVEPGGRGGVFHHATALAAALAEAGVPVLLHSSAEPEITPQGVPCQPCLWPFRRLRPRGLRRAAIVSGWLLAGVPRCLSRLRPGDVVQLEGRFLGALWVPLLAGARLRGCFLALSPHNTFSRSGRRSDDLLVRWMARRADVVLAFSDHDRRRIEGWGAAAAQVPLCVPATRAEPGLVTGWRRRWGLGPERRVVLFAGQVRFDKGLDVLVRAVALRRGDLALAVVGEDVGALGAARQVAAELGVAMHVHDRYHPLDDFVAAVAAADVIACPYRAASQSAVLALADALGRPTVASDIGGMAELATTTVPPENPEALAAGIERALAAGCRAPRRCRPGDLVLPYLEAYRLRTPAGPGQ